MEEKDIELLKTTQLNILKEVDKVCKKRGLEYFLAFGTAIGAERHKGFIPWDDDIDIYMTIDDMKVLESSQGLFPSNIFVQTSRTDPEYGLMIMRIRDSSTTLIENEECDRDINHGVFVDVYPLYNAPSDKKALASMHRWSLIGRLLLYNRPPRNHGKAMRIISKVILFLTPDIIRKKIVSIAYNKLTKYKDTGLLTRARMDGRDGKEGKQIPVFPKEYFFPAKRVLFENILFPVPAQNHEILSILYGDYMKLPPEEKRVIHHDYRIVDCNNSYRIYKGKEYCIKEKI